MPQHSRSKIILHGLRKTCISTEVKPKDAKVRVSPISASVGTVALIYEVGNNSLQRDFRLHVGGKSGKSPGGRMLVLVSFIII